MAIKELFYDNRPQVLLDPRASQRIDPRFKFTRNSPTTINKDGVITQVPAGYPIIGFDSPGSENTANNGLRLEQSTTNVFWFSSNFTAEWFVSSGNTTFTKNAGTAPDGSNNAGLFYQNAPCSNNQARLALNAGGFPITTTGQHVFSAFVKLQTSATANKIGFAIGDNRFSHLPGQVASYITLVFNFNSEGALVSSDSPYGQFVYCGNGWYRIWIPMHKATGVTNPGISVLAVVVGAEDSQPAGYYGRFLVWGPQFEKTNKGITPTSYIYTSSNSGVTRAADLLSIESISIPSTGSIYIDAQAVSANKNDTLLSLKNSSNDKIDLAYLSNASTYNSLALIANYDGTSKSSLPLPVPTTNRERNIITWGAQNYQYSRDSARFATSLSSSVPTGLNKLSIGHDAVDPTKAFNGYINTVYAWSGELTPAVAEALVRNDLDPINADTYSPTGPAGALALVINTQGASADGDKTFTLPAESAATDNDIVITWGDGTESGLDGADAEVGASGLTHTYPAAGIYPVWVEGQMENIYYNNIANAPDLLQIAAWGTGDMFTAPSTMQNAFYGCSQMDFSSSARNTNLPDTSAVQNWSQAFWNCSSITGTFPAFNFSAATSFFRAWRGCSSMTSFVAAGDQTQNVTNFAEAWRDCSSLTSFPSINTSVGTNFSNAWTSCSSLTSFPLINTAAGTNFSNAWNGCSSLTSFPLINTAAGTNLSSMLQDCSGLTTVPLLNTGAATNLEAFLRGTSITSVPLFDTAAATNMAQFLRATPITSCPTFNTALNTRFDSFFDNCTSLTAIPPLDTSAGTNFYRFALGCGSITSLPTLDYTKATNMARAFSNCTQLTTFPAASFPLVSGAMTGEVGFNSTWVNCTSLANFPANAFNSTQALNFASAFENCALTAASIENIIVSINTAGTSNGNLTLSGGTNAGASTWTANAVAAYNALIARGWTVTRNV